MIQSNGQKSLPAIGFLTVTHDVEQGRFGGYLVLNALGRPLEFHCTAPVRPNRAQQILYGPTLDPYLCGERIGPVLLSRSKTVPSVVFTDLEPAMAARAWVSVPMALVLPRAATPLDPSTSPEPETGPPEALETRDLGREPGAEPTRPGPSPLTAFHLGAYHVAVAADHPEDRQQVCQCWLRFAEQIDLDEPFGRIREAIDEARASLK